TALRRAPARFADFIRFLPNGFVLRKWPRGGHAETGPLKPLLLSQLGSICQNAARARVRLAFVKNNESTSPLHAERALPMAVLSALANRWRALVMARNLRRRHNLLAIRAKGKEAGTQEHSVVDGIFSTSLQKRSIGAAKLSGRSSAKNSRASSTSITSRAPGMVSRSQHAHFLSKKKSCRAQTISVGTCSVFNASWTA